MTPAASEPRFTTVANTHRHRNKWPWAIRDAKDGTLCGFASNKETAESAAAGLNRNMDKISALEIDREVP